MSIFAEVASVCTKLCFFGSLMWLFSGCRVVNVDQLRARTEAPDKFMTEGYYYYSYTQESYRNAANETVPAQTYINPLFLYKDGSCLRTGSFTSHQDIVSYVQEENLYDEVGVSSGWGNFFIEGDVITVQTVEMLSSGGVPVLIGIVEEKGKVLNDRSFVIESISIPRRKENKNLKKPLIYKFMSNAPKPDSANWVKEKIEQKKK